MEHDSYTPEPGPSSVEIVLEEVNNYRSAVDEIEANQNLSEEQKKFEKANAAIEYLKIVETLPEKIQRLAMYAHSTEDKRPDNTMEIAA